MHRDPQELGDHSVRGIEGVTIQLESAPFLRRVGAYLVDLGVVTAIVYVAVIILAILVMFVAVAGGLLSESFGALLAIAGIVLGILALLALYDAYFVYFEYKRGATLGKRLMGLKVVTLEGNKPSLGQCVARDLLRYVDCMLLFPGPIAIALSSKRQRLGDMVAHTRVVYSKRAEAAQHALYLDFDTFMLYLAESPSQSMSRAFATDFMTYTSKRFLLGSSDLSNAQSEAEWVERYERETGQKRPSVASERECLRFFAECCVRRLAAADKRTEIV